MLLRAGKSAGDVQVVIWRINKGTRESRRQHVCRAHEKVYWVSRVLRVDANVILQGTSEIENE
jgi:hypothetical protein